MKHKIKRCINPKCNRKVTIHLFKVVDLFCQKCINNLSIFTKLKIYRKQLESKGKLEIKKTKTKKKSYFCECCGRKMISQYYIEFGKICFSCNEWREKNENTIN